MRKYITLIFVGLLNLLHASMHLLQFLQSLILIYSSPKRFGKEIEINNNESLIDKLIHNPYINIIWMIVAIFTLYLGIKDYLHHKRCKH